MVSSSRQNLGFIRESSRPLTDRKRTLSSLLILLTLMLMSLPAFTGFAYNIAAAQTSPPQLIKLTNGNTDSLLLPDSRFQVGYNTVQGPSLGALAAWTTTSGATSNYGYASLLGSVPTAEKVPEPVGSGPGCIVASTACPSLDEGYLRTIASSTSNLNTSVNVFDTRSGTAQTIYIHSPATSETKCLTSNLTTVSWCNFLSVYTSGGGAVGVAPFPHILSGPVTVYSNEVVNWTAGKWSQVTPNDYQIVQTPCTYSNGPNIAFFFDPTVLAAISGTGTYNFMPGDSGHFAYAVVNYRLDTPSGGCSLLQHQTSVVMYIDGSPIDTLAFPPFVGNTTFNTQSCAISRCFGGFIGYTGNLLLYRTYTGSDGNSSYWVYDKLDGFTRQITHPDLSVTDGSRLLWVTQDTGNPGNNVVWVYDPANSVVASNGTVLHHVYPIGSFGGAGLAGGAQPFGVDGNTVLWYYTNSTSTYLQAYELYDKATLKGRLLPAVDLGGTPTYGQYGTGLQLYYDSGMAAWMGSSGNATDPWVIHVYNVTAAEAGQPSLSSVRLGAYGFNSVVGSSFSQGWFFINGKTTSDPVTQVYTFNVAGLPATPTTSGTTSSSTGVTSSSASVQTTPAQTTTNGTQATSATAITSTSASQVTSTTAASTSGSSAPSSGFSTQVLEYIAGVVAAIAIILLGYFFLRKSDRRREKGTRRTRGSKAVSELVPSTSPDEGFEPIPPKDGPTEEEKKGQDEREVG